ncbi:MAG: D-alanyl-D-alanine carboxypeptidase, partial [Alphaproteobacteria bacterium]|nr:D-alanyl-D-alanine carboxypeptidase [Brevundimonas sp.]MBU3974125.1 D-alanyl-D-alanine carboxypeptidase [Alphaproteobacteria bacterium]
MPMRLFLLLISALATVLVSGPARAQAEFCDRQIEDWGGPALANGISLHSLEWAPFGSAEWGW